jgi:metal-sulfur cluster biosynthetic enzyme
MSSEQETKQPDEAVPLDPEKRKELEEKIVKVLKTCYDPEIPVDIYELGLIVAESLPPDVERKIKTLPGIQKARVDVVWDPPWAPTMMSEAAKLQLNMM